MIIETKKMTKYCLIKFDTITIGCVLFSKKLKFCEIKLIEEHDKVIGFDSKNYLFVDHVKGQIKNWIETNKLPYDENNLKPYQEKFWLHVRELLVHNVRISQSQKSDVDDINLLFKKIIKYDY